MHPRRCWRVVVQVQRCLHINGSPVSPRGPTRTLETPSSALTCWQPTSGRSYGWVDARIHGSSRSYGCSFLIFVPRCLFPRRSVPKTLTIRRYLKRICIRGIRGVGRAPAVLPQAPHPAPCRAASRPTLHFAIRRGGLFSTGGIDTNSTWLRQHRTVSK